MLGDESEKIEIPLRVAHHAAEIINLKQAQIAVIILNAFLLELGALFGRQLVAFAFFLRAGRAPLMIFEERVAVVRALSIGPAGHFHLEHAQIDAQLQLLAAIEPGDLAHFNVAVLVRPISQDRIQIQTHLR